MRGGMTCSLGFTRWRDGLEQAIDDRRDIINILFTCLPSKNCPPRIIAGSLYRLFCLHFFSRAVRSRCTPIRLKKPHAIWPANYAPLPIKNQ
jgi:hypothetical protein